MAEFISTLADVSTMWLVCLSFILCLIPLAIVGGMAYGMRKLVIALRPVLQRGQETMAKAAGGANKLSKSIAAPFIAISAFASQIRGTLHSLDQMIRRKA
jgi:hypothetical protein